MRSLIGFGCAAMRPGTMCGEHLPDEREAIDLVVMFACRE